MLSLNRLLDDSGLGWILKEADAINNSGQIVGYGINPDGHSEAFLLTPVATPEPASLLLVATGLIGLIGLMRLRR